MILRQVQTGTHSGLPCTVEETQEDLQHMPNHQWVYSTPEWQWFQKIYIESRKDDLISFLLIVSAVWR